MGAMPRKRSSISPLLSHNYWLLPNENASGGPDFSPSDKQKEYTCMKYNGYHISQSEVTSLMKYQREPGGGNNAT